MTAKRSRAKQSADVELPAPSASGGGVPPRLTVQIDGSLRRKLRIAAARADMEVGEWCKVVLVTAAQRIVERLYPDEGE